jgi:hypothetical protein
MAMVKENAGGGLTALPALPETKLRGDLAPSLAVSAYAAFW